LPNARGRSRFGNCLPILQEKPSHRHTVSSSACFE
jgi:hypothetical protein